MKSVFASSHASGFLASQSLFSPDGKYLFVTRLGKDQYGMTPRTPCRAIVRMTETERPKAESPAYTATPQIMKSK